LGLFDAVTDETENGSSPEEEGEEASKLRGGGRGCNDERAKRAVKKRLC
jgi:hypothetical protein